MQEDRALVFAGCAKVPGGDNSRAPTKCCTFRMSLCSTREHCVEAWGAWGAEPALGPPLAHSLGQCISLTPPLFFQLVTIINQ